MRVPTTLSAISDSVKLHSSDRYGLKVGSANSHDLGIFILQRSRISTKKSTLGSGNRNIRLFLFDTPFARLFDSCCICIPRYDSRFTTSMRVHHIAYACYCRATTLLYFTIDYSASTLDWVSLVLIHWHSDGFLGIWLYGYRLILLSKHGVFICGGSHY